ncbi:peptidase [Planctomicrobium sp. SH664]|uniref:peptidase n=1 Tax=Planctomicrobium sp. SH664 TaxID=3448125 RepID=UPI003F5BD0ED
MKHTSSRREFLKVTGASLFAAGVAPAIVGATDKAGTKPVIIGEGDYKYECHHGWGEVPDSIQWNTTHGVTFDRDGLVYIKHRGDAKAPCDCVVVFEPNGKFVRSFGAEYAGGGHGIDLREENGKEYLYLCDTQNLHVTKCDTKGDIVWRVEAPKEPGVYDAKHRFKPTNVCFGPQQDVYIGDGYGSSYMHQYTNDGKWIRTWGGTGAKAGQMRTPHGQWLDTRGTGEPELVVADRANSRLQYFTLDGKPTRILQGVKEADREKHGTTGTLADASGHEIPVTYVYGISFPAAIDIQGDLLLLPDLHARVILLDGQNHIVANLGLDEEWTTNVLSNSHPEGKIRLRPDQWEAGKFVHPHDAAFDKDGNIIVVEWVEPGRITFLRRV